MTQIFRIEGGERKETEPTPQSPNFILSQNNEKSSINIFLVADVIDSTVIGFWLVGCSVRSMLVEATVTFEQGREVTFFLKIKNYTLSTHIRRHR